MGAMATWMKESIAPLDKPPHITKDEVTKIVAAVSAEAKLPFQRPRMPATLR